MARWATATLKKITALGKTRRAKLFVRGAVAAGSALDAGRRRAFERSEPDGGRWFGKAGSGWDTGAKGPTNVAVEELAAQLIGLIYCD